MGNKPDIKHTPEPWIFDERAAGVVYANADDERTATKQRPVLFVSGYFGIPQQEANAKRVALCVNACAGIPDEDLKPDMFLGFWNVIVRTRKMVNYA